MTISASGPSQMAARIKARNVAKRRGAAKRRRLNVRRSVRSATLDIESASEHGAKHQGRNGYREDKNRDANRRAVAKTRIPEALQIDQIAQNVGAAEGGALGHDSDEVKRLQRFEQGQHHHDRGYRPQLRQRHPQHHSKMSRAFDPGGVEGLFWNVADPREIENHRQTGEGPAADEGQRVNRDAIIAKPLADQKAEAERSQNGVEGAKNGMEDQEKHQTDSDQRHRHGKEDCGAQQGWEIDSAHPHCVRNEKSEHDRERQRNHKPPEIIFQRNIKIFIAKHVRVIRQTDESLGRRHSVPLKKAQIDCIDNRIANETREQENGGDNPEQSDEDMIAGEGEKRVALVIDPGHHPRSLVSAASGDESLSPSRCDVTIRGKTNRKLDHAGRGMSAADTKVWSSRMIGDWRGQVLILPRTRSASVSVAAMASCGEMAPASTPWRPSRNLSEIAGGVPWSTCMKVYE